jgi:hypothetical protein
MIANRGQASHSNRGVAAVVFRTQPGPLSDPPQHPRPNLVPVVEGKFEIRPTRECSQYAFRFTGGPVAHRES